MLDATYRIHITADFDSEEEATEALANAEEEIGKQNGEIEYTEIEKIDH